jgi:hyaluronoglucosaminidase|nr:MAG TPA: hyaluronidase [Caudoviricetes sp.]
MAEKIPIRVQHKRMSSSEWLASPLILLDGEIGIETNTGKAKIGNGISRYSDLKYIAGEKGERGENGTFQALAPQEKASLKGERGEKGQDGINGKDAILGNYNLILDSQFTNTDIITSGNPTMSVITNDYNGRNALDVKKSGAASNTWAGVQLNTTQTLLKNGDKLVLRLPIYIYSDVNLDSGLYLAIKKHSINKTIKTINLSNLPRNQWTIYEEKFTITETLDFGSETQWFFLYFVKNGHFKIAEPYISFGDEVPSKWQPNLENLKGSNIINQQNGQPLKYWIGTEQQYFNIPAKDANTIYDIVE